MERQTLGGPGCKPRSFCSGLDFRTAVPHHRGELCVLRPLAPSILFLVTGVYKRHLLVQLSGILGNPCRCHLPLGTALIGSWPRKKQWDQRFSLGLGFQCQKSGAETEISHAELLEEILLFPSRYRPTVTQA